MGQTQKLVKISTPSNAILEWITPIFSMAITRQRIELESCTNPLKKREILLCAEWKFCSVWVVGLFGRVYTTTGCFCMFRQVCQKMWWRQHPVVVQESSRFHDSWFYWI